MAKIEAVLFDYGMVLSGPPDAAERKRMEELLSADSESFHAAYWKFRDDYDRGILSGTNYWHEVAKNLGKTLDASTLTSLIEADTMHWAQPNEPMIAWASALQRAGVKTGILSNMGDAMEDGLLENLPWLRNFTNSTYSHRLNLAKPDAAIYRMAAEGLGVLQAAILFIDDREENIAAAKNAGMQAVVYRTYQPFVAEMQQAGYAYLISL
jgi:putative hydrolase of the HAD superfamily